MDFSRRSLLKGVALGAGALMVGGGAAMRLSSTALGAAENFSGNPNRNAMLTDITMCVGCRSCERSCNRANNLPPPEQRFADPSVFGEVRRPSATAWTVVNRYENPVKGEEPIYRRVQCMHCDEPSCVSACLVGALKKSKEGPVIYDENVCIGCRYCMNACPFNMLSFEFDDPFHPAIRKCLMCYRRIIEGKVPACVSGCPVGATVFGKRSDLIDMARTRIQANPGKYQDHIYGEAEVGGTGWLYLSPVSFDTIGFSPDVGTKAYPEYTREWLLGVPVVLVGWPALMLGLHMLSKRKEQVAEAEANEKAEE